MQAENLSSYVELFDRDAYHSNISVAENLVFGTPRHPSLQPVNLPSNPEVVGLLRDVGLLDDFYAAGATVAGLMVELFADVAPDSPMFDQYSFISADDLPEFRVLVAKIADGNIASIDEEEKARLLALTFRIVVAQHRIGVIDEDAAAQDRRGARRVPAALHGSRRLRRILRSRSLQLDAVDPGQHSVRPRRVRAGQCAGASSPRSCARSWPRRE